MPPPALEEGWAADAGGSAHVFLGVLAEVPELTGEDAHHLSRVLRLRAGEVVTAADGSGCWRPYLFRPPAGLEALGPVQVEPRLTPRLGVAFALTKGHKPDLVVQKLTELGIDRILPVLSERSIARPDPSRAAVQVERWRRVARQAAGQCRRARLPEVADLAALAGLSAHPGLMVAERGGDAPGELHMPPGEEVVVAVGPEGGFTREEVEALRPHARLDLGAHVLRAETAALAAAATVSALRTSRFRAGRSEPPAT